MITEFEERSQDAATVHFTVPRSSLPNLLQWTERLQARFRVAIKIQWELDPQAVHIGEATHVRWVALDGDTADCQKAKEYITTLCNAVHKMNITYPEGIHTELKDAQIKMEESYSCVLQFLKIGEILAKSNDEISLSLVLSIIEEKALQYEKRNRFMHSVDRQGASDDEHEELDLDVDSIGVESISPDDEPEYPIMRSRLSASPQTPTKQKDLLGGGPLMLRCKNNAVIPRQQNMLFSPVSSQSSISPDRKKIKSHSHHQDRGSGSRSSSPNFLGRDTHSGSVFTLHLSSKQMLAIQRLKDRGDFKQSEVDRVLQKAGSDWECSDLVTMLQRERSQKSTPPVASSPTAPASDLEKLKSTQESLMQSLWKESSPNPVKRESLSEFNLKSCSSPVNWTDKAQAKETVVFKDEKPIKIEASHPYFNEGGKQLEVELDNHDEVSIVTEDEADSIIVIGDTSEESDALEEFYIKGVLQEQPRKASGLQSAKHGTKSRQFSQVDVPPAEERPKQDKQHGVIESLQQKLLNLEDKLERDRAEASCQQQVATLLQQTQQEEMERQYQQQQQRLLKQQQEFQKQFEMQEQKLKVQQENTLKQLQQQQQRQQEKQKEEQAKAAAEESSEAIVIAPPRRTPASPLRPVVIDGSNVAMSHGRSKVYSCRGIAICIQYFQKLGHQDITVFVPQGRRTQNPNAPGRPMKDQQILEQFEKQGLLSFTPSRRIGSTYVNCYDDRFIVKLAVENDGVIVSNDNYRDLMGESPEWKYVIENRLVMYTFAGDRFMIPDDPLGRRGPRIDQILRKSQPLRTVAATFGRRSVLMAPVPQVPAVLLTIPSRAVPMRYTAVGMTGAQVARHSATTFKATSTSRDVPMPEMTPLVAKKPAQWGGGEMTGAQVVKHGATTSQTRPQPAPATSASRAVPMPGMAPLVGKKNAQWGTSEMTGAQAARHGATTSKARPQLAIATSASSDVPMPEMAPSVGRKPAQWGTGEMTSAQVVRHRATTSKAKPQSALSSSASKAAVKPGITPLVGKKPAQDQRDHPCYEILLAIFPDNEDEVLRVLAKNIYKKDANELVMQVIVEKEKSES